MELTPMDPSDTREIEHVISALAQVRDSGLIVGVSSAALIYREQIVALAARHKLPAVYPYRFYVTAGGLISYGPDLTDLYRRAAGYVDRILKAQSPPICRFRTRPSTSSRSISKPPRRSASIFLRLCSPAPTR